ATAAKTLIVEHPRQGDRKLKTGQPWETTDSYYRFRVALTAGQATELPVTEVISRQTSVTLTNLTRAQLVSTFSNKETPQEVRTKLGQIVDAQERIAGLKEDLTTAQAQIDSLFRDQERLRENIKALRDTREEQDLRSRYLTQLTRQENQIDTTRGDVEKLKKDIATAETQLAEMISKLTWQ